MYRINELKITVDEWLDNKVGTEKSGGSDSLKKLLREKLEKKIGAEVSELSIVRESVDARDKGDIRLIYTLDFKCEKELSLGPAPDLSYEEPIPGSRGGGAKLSHRPVIVGFGPCGIFAGLILAKAGYAPIILERGKPVGERVRDVEAFWQSGILNPRSNVQFGEGGAGTFSDGKLTTQIKDKRVRKVLSLLAEAGGGPEILYKQKPHIGTDRLRSIVPALRKQIEALGGEVRFNTKLEGIKVSDGKLTSLTVSTADIPPAATGALPEKQESEIPADALILAIGHSARDTYEMLYKAGLPMEQKQFSMGVRAEHLQSEINKSQYGDFAHRLPPADYKLAHRTKEGRGVYSFCMCPGGEVIVASSEPEGLVVNGMSNSKRDGKYANSAILVDVRKEDFPSDHPLSGIELQRTYERLAFKLGGENYKPPVTTLKSFKAGPQDPVRASLPPFAAEAILEAMPHFGRKIKGFDGPQVRFTAVETRSSAPVRLLRDRAGRSAIEGIYPGGEGAGYAGGIVSAAVDGIRIAEEIIESYLPAGC